MQRAAALSIRSVGRQTTRYAYDIYMFAVLTFENVHQYAGRLRVAGHAGEIARMLATSALNRELR